MSGRDSAYPEAMSASAPRTPDSSQGSKEPAIRITARQGIAALVLIVLLVFIFSNRHSVTIEFIAWSFHTPLWVALLGTAVIAAGCTAAALAVSHRRKRH